MEAVFISPLYFLFSFGLLNLFKRAHHVSGTEDLKKVRHGPRPHELVSQQGRWTHEEGTLSPPCKQDGGKLGVHSPAQVRMEAPNCLPGCPLAKRRRRVKGSLPPCAGTAWEVSAL